MKFLEFTRLGWTTSATDRCELHTTIPNLSQFNSENIIGEVNKNAIYDLSSGFNLVMANPSLDAQLADGIAPAKEEPRGYVLLKAVLL